MDGPGIGLFKRLLKSFRWSEGCGDLGGSMAYNPCDFDFSFPSVKPCDGLDEALLDSDKGLLVTEILKPGTVASLEVG